MGLDFVELIMATEEKFGIEIADEEAQRVRTVKDLRKLVEGKLTLSDEKTCLSQRAFNTLRKSFTEVLQLPRRSFRPDSLLEDVVPRENRIRLWTELKSATRAPYWPELSRSSLVSNSIILGTLGIPLLWCTWLKSNSWNWSPCIVTSVAVGIIVGSAGVFLTRPLQLEFEHRDVRSLAEFLVGKCPETLGLNKYIWTPERIEFAVRHLVVDQLGVKESEVRDEATFLDDLGVD